MLEMVGTVHMVEMVEMVETLAVLEIQENKVVLETLALAEMYLEELVVLLVLYLLGKEEHLDTH
jgi:hypothetical protein